ncbi:MAG: ACT domain-containing protein [Ruminococcus sp.]|nr:ACT domain-containing protein [Ruminococcus sp.]
MKAIITVIGKDTVGILAKVSDACAKADVNIVEVTQSVLQDMFAMVMLVEIDKANIAFDQLKSNLDEVGTATKTKIHIMHEDIFNAMHKIDNDF